MDFRHWPTLTDFSGVWTGAIWNWHLTAWFSGWWVMTCANHEVRNRKTGWIISVESSVCLYLQIYLSIYRQMMCDITTAHLLIIWRHMWGRHFRVKTDCWILLASPDDCLCCRASQKTLWMSCWAGTVMTRWSCEILTTWRSERRRSTSQSSKVWMCNTEQDSSNMITRSQKAQTLVELFAADVQMKHGDCRMSNMQDFVLPVLESKCDDGLFVHFPALCEPYVSTQSRSV